MNAGFAIRESAPRVGDFALVPPDIATCDDCLRDFTQPGNRRYRYPFTNCTNCGPRYTIIQTFPMTAPPPPWRLSPCARPAPPNTTTPPTAVFMPSPMPARFAARRFPPRIEEVRGVAARRAKSWPSRAWAATIWPATRANARRRAQAAPAQAARR